MNRIIFLSLIIGIGLGIISLFVLQLGLSTNLATLTTSVHGIESTVSALQDDNDRMAQKISSASSLMTVDTQARLMGFTDPEKRTIVHIRPGELPVALGRDH